MTDTARVTTDIGVANLALSLSFCFRCSHCSAIEAAAFVRDNSYQRASSPRSALIVKGRWTAAHSVSLLAAQVFVKSGKAFRRCSRMGVLLY